MAGDAERKYQASVLGILRQKAARLTMIEMEFEAIIWYWRGPALHYFVTVSPKQCEDLQAISGLVTYGWGMIPVSIRIGKTEWKTSLFPKNGGYIVPIKADIRKSEGLDESDNVTLVLSVTIKA